MDAVPTRRLYHSPQRQRRARATRTRITSAARRLFARRGSAATSIEAIAAVAGVAAPTVYATLGSKRAILLALLDTMEQEAGVARLETDLAEAKGDPPRELEVLVDFDCRLFEDNLDVLEILRDARAADPRLMSVWREGGRRRRGGQVRLVRAWSAARLLTPGLRHQEAADILWAFTGPDVYRLLVVESDWRVPRFRRWLRDSLSSLLFGRGHLNRRMSRPAGTSARPGEEIDETK